MYKYASVKISKLEAEGKLTRRSHFKKWSPLTLPELQGFLAIIFNMGIIRLPELKDYWKTSWVAEVPLFSRMMSRDHFELVFWVLHASHSTGPLKKIDKVRLFVEKILAKFQAKYTPTQELRYTYHLLVTLHRTLPISERSGAFRLSIDTVELSLPFGAVQRPVMMKSKCLFLPKGTRYYQQCTC